MKKTVLILSVATLLLASCKKNEKADHIAPETTNTNAVQNNPSPVYKQEDLVAEAKSKPLTTIALAENHFEFGKIKKGEHVEHRYEVTNTGINPLIISAVKPGCGCTAPDYTKEPIKPGGKGFITLKFDSSNFDGLINKQAEIYANVESTPITITFSGDVQP